jgi:hypothetical protein
MLLLPLRSMCSPDAGDASPGRRLQNGLTANVCASDRCRLSSAVFCRRHSPANDCAMTGLHLQADSAARPLPADTHVQRRCGRGPSDLHDAAPIPHDAHFRLSLAQNETHWCGPRPQERQRTTHAAGASQPVKRDHRTALRGAVCMLRSACCVR